MELDPCSATVSDHVLDVFIGNKKDSFNIEDIDKINAIEKTERSHSGKILGGLFGTGAQFATGDLFGLFPLIGAGAGALYDEFFGDEKTIKYLEVFPIKGNKLRYTLNPTANIKKLNTDFRNFQKKYIQKAIDEDINKINKSKISDKFFEENKNKYISYSELKVLYTNFAFNEYSKYSQVENLNEILDKVFQEKYNKIKNFLENSYKIYEEKREKHNDNFVNNNLQHPMFNKMAVSIGKINNAPAEIDIKQKKSILVDEDNLLINASAGSGKTTALLGKVRYILEQKLAKPNEILVLSFARKIRKEIKIKLNDIEDMERQIHTFHSFGWKFVKTAVKTSRKSDFQDYLNRSINKSSKLKTEIFEYFLGYAKHYKSPFTDFITKEDYLDYVRSEEKITLKRKTKDGDYEIVKSLEEIDIANYLYINGINYIYEKEIYDPTIGTKKPDFYLPDYDIYYEHWALDENEEPPKIFEGYLENYHQKRKYYKEKKFKLIETKSAHKSKGILFNELEKQLKKYNVKFNPQNEDKILQEFRNQNKYSLLAELLYNFFHHYRSNSYDNRVVLTKIYDLKVEHEKLRSLKFLGIYNAVYKSYREDYKKLKRIDFYDMIDDAIDRVPNENLKYILVDEFQDTSRARCRLLEAIKRKNNNSKLFAVGDDWQSIEAFAGSDIKIMTRDFEKIFGFKKTLTLDKTFRFNQTLCDITNEFILRNKYQLRKKVKSNIQENNQKTVEFQEFNIDHKSNDIKNYKNKEEILKNYYLFLFLNKINKELVGNTTILTRYKYKKYGNTFGKIQIGTLLSNYENIAWSTIHGFKGRESNNVIVDRLQSGYFAFPVEIPEDPILFLVKNFDPNEMADAEERRLFYVALTRAKNKIFVISNKSRPSKYLEEIKKICKKYDTFEIKKAKKTDNDAISFQERLNKIKLKYPITFKKWKEVDDKNYPESRSNIKLKYPKAYQKWSDEEDNKLRGFLKSQKCIYEISTIFKRKPTAICSRIMKFEDESLTDK